MNKQQRNQWDKWVETTTKDLAYGQPQDNLVLIANAYILKLERELQNLKGGRKVAAILKSKVVS